MLLQQLANGVMLGSTYALVAIGYTLIFGVLRLLHLAHGEVFMVGAFAGLQTVLLVAVSGRLAALIGGLVALGSRRHAARAGGVPADPQARQFPSRADRQHASARAWCCRRS